MIKCIWCEVERGHLHYSEANNEWWVFCDERGCRGPACATDAEALEAWEAQLAKDEQIARLRELRDSLRVELMTILDQVDYTIGNCRLNEPIAGVLPREIIESAKAALAEEDD